MSQQTEYYPDVVVCLENTDDISRLMKYAWENEVPVTPRGAGSGQTGGSVAIKGGIVLDVSGWTDIVEIDDANMQVVVCPGIVHSDLNDELAPYGLFFPPDQGSSKMATICGMVSNNASGLRAEIWSDFSIYTWFRSCFAQRRSHENRRTYKHS